MRSSLLGRVAAMVIAPAGLIGTSEPGRMATLAPQLAPIQVLASCTPTAPNGETPPGERPSPNHHGNGVLWTSFWSDGTIVFKPGGPGSVLDDGSLQMKFPFWHSSPGPLTISGQRLDAAAPELRAATPTGYSGMFQATSLIFATPGCWEVSAHLGEASLTFVVWVVKIGAGPVQSRLPQAAAQQRMHPAARGISGRRG